MRILRANLLILLLLSSGCVARRSDGSVNLNASTTQTILMVEASYEEIMRSLGNARRAGEISATVLEHGRAMGVQVATAIDMAKVTTAAYLRSGGSRAPVFAALATLTTVIAQLERMYLDSTGRTEVP